MGDFASIGLCVLLFCSNTSFWYVFQDFALISDNFADYKQLRGGVYFVQSLPLTPSGKVLRRCVKELAIKMYNEVMMESNS